ncbi:NAD(P)H-binding protein [Halomicrococcus sp. NG-SE-24]|uniref:NAD(P)H-binding protein n=1 Tax=Halomicrococcus sp. NG-SE-24 TaxID=3436928 RepID=UPI003D9714A0
MERQNDQQRRLQPRDCDRQARQEELIIGSDLNWTIVCPGSITDDPKPESTNATSTSTPPLV